MRKLLRLALLMAAAGVLALVVAYHHDTGPTGPGPVTTSTRTTATTAAAGPATVLDTTYERDPNNPSTGTHYADCRASNGTEYRVVISAAQDYGGLTKGDRCPDGPHLPTPRQENPGLYDEISSALNSPMPYSGGNADGPCGAWSAADPTDAAQMSTAYQQCMAQHGAGH